MGGCWEFSLEPVQAPYITRELPYTAILQFPYKQNERILDVAVWEELGARYDHTLNFSTCWRIKPVHRVPARDFQLQIGQVPQGFTQIIPADGEQFTPKPGGKYALAIRTTNKRARYGTWWAPAK
jgi:hypothetical protein